MRRGVWNALLLRLESTLGKSAKKRLVIFGAPPGHRMRSNCGKVAIEKLRKRSEWAGPERSRCARIAFWSARAEDFFRDDFGSRGTLVPLRKNSVFEMTLWTRPDSLGKHSTLEAGPGRVSSAFSSRCIKAVVLSSRLVPLRKNSGLERRLFRTSQMRSGCDFGALWLPRGRAAKGFGTSQRPLGGGAKCALVAAKRPFGYSWALLGHYFGVDGDAQKYIKNA